MTSCFVAYIVNKYWLNVFQSVCVSLREGVSSHLDVGQRSLLLCVFSVFAASVLGDQLAEAAAGHLRVELAALYRYTPGGQRQSNRQWMRSVCPVSFGSQRGLSSLIAPPTPAEPPPLALCVWTLLPVDSPLSGLLHVTVSNHPAHPPLNPEPPSPSPASSRP